MNTTYDEYLFLWAAVCFEWEWYAKEQQKGSF